MPTVRSMMIGNTSIATAWRPSMCQQPYSSATNRRGTAAKAPVFCGIQVGIATATPKSSWPLCRTVSPYPCGYPALTLQALHILHQKLTWQDGTRDADAPAVLNKLQETLHPVEQLCDNEVTSCVDLLLEISQAVPVVLLHLLWVVHYVVGMSLGVSCNTDAEVVPMLLPASRTETNRVMQL